MSTNPQFYISLSSTVVMICSGRISLNMLVDKNTKSSSFSMFYQFNSFLDIYSRNV